MMRKVIQQRYRWSSALMQMTCSPQRVYLLSVLVPEYGVSLETPFGAMYRRHAASLEDRNSIGSRIGILTRCRPPASLECPFTNISSHFSFSADRIHLVGISSILLPQSIPMILLSYPIYDTFSAWIVPTPPYTNQPSSENCHFKPPDFGLRLARLYFHDDLPKLPV